ncbi:putative surface exclusion protein [Streptococcus sp. DD10]|uniref:LPXTG cell wall anchor domain-containing protein n=1 Tax=Streptococcus sp. DD10 TaxID=1777878 RepID=UPI000797C686|nr:LPXTG cell wall anchor domain-containing protein [Streptococcus sp. DD10]KXT76249.1 putative surface exclusion protein [Streptococcus sp. DD10]
MKTKLSKSLLATSLATAGIIVGTEQVHADSENQENTVAENNTEAGSPTITTTEQVTSNVESILKENATPQPSENKEEVTEILVQIAKEQVEDSRQKITEQVNITKAAESKVNEANAKVDAANQEVAQKEQDVKDATVEMIAKTEETIETATLEVSARQEDVAQTKSNEQEAQKLVEQQKNVVSGKETLVEMAQAEIAKAEEPIQREKVAVEVAQKAVEAAQQTLSEKQAELADATTTLQNRDQLISEAQQKVAIAEQNLATINETISQKETELATEKAKPAVSTEYSYSNFLDYLQSQVSDSAYANLVTQARAEYDKHGTVNNSNSGSYENALTAVRILRSVNEARKAAGLPELYINPFINYESQIQVEASRSKLNSGNPHSNIYNANENLAWGGSPEWAVNYWQNEKAAYQQLANQYGLPTDETQLDANAIYMKIPSEFYKVGHYVQDMGNQFNVATTAYVDTISQIGFRSVSNLQSLINAGVVMTVDQYENKLREFSAALQSGVSSNASKVQAELDALKAQRTGYESSLSIARSVYNEQIQGKSTDQTTMQSAASSVLVAQENLVKAKSTLETSQNNYTVAYATISTQVAPLQGNLKVKEAELAESKVELARLENAYLQAQEKAKQVQNLLQRSEENLAKAKQRLSDLQNAPQNLLVAKASLAEALLQYKDALEQYQKEVNYLNELQTIYAKLQTTYSELQTKYDLLHPNQENQHPGVRFTGVNYNAANVVASEKSETSKQKRKVLPTTGTRSSEALAAAGLIVGVSSLVAGKKRKED